MQSIKSIESTQSNANVFATESACPACGERYLTRVPPRIIDRVLSLILPVQRYRCGHYFCQWVGNIRVFNNAHTTKR